MYADYEHLYYNSLYHSGVKGTKWGVRKRAAEYAKSIGQQLGYGGVAAIAGKHIKRTFFGGSGQLSGVIAGRIKANDTRIAALNYIEYKNKTPKAVKDLHIERIAQMALPPAR